MKQKFSSKWKASKLPRKQRKFRANAPLHVKHKMMSAHLNETLRKRHGKRNIPIRKDDDVKIMKGEFKGKTGKIENVDLKKSRVMIGGIFRTKKDGTKVGVYFHPSNLLIKELNLEDKQRVKSLERKASPLKKKVENKEENKEENKDKKKETKIKFKAKPLPKTEEKPKEDKK